MNLNGTDPTVRGAMNLQRARPNLSRVSASRLISGKCVRRPCERDMNPMRSEGDRKREREKERAIKQNEIQSTSIYRKVVAHA